MTGIFRRVIGLRFSVFLLTILVFSNDVVAECPRKPIPDKDRPVHDRQVVFATCNDPTDGWQLTELSNTEHYVSQFSEEDIWIFFGVKPNRARDGAVGVTVARYFEGVSHDKVHLYRNNNFFNYGNSVLSPRCSSSRLGGFEDEVTKRAYDEFHMDDGQIHATLKWRFHECWSADSNSDTYTARDSARQWLRFEESANSDAAARSYLLRYETSSKGSWIPFSIGTGGRNRDRLKRVEIIIADLADTRRDPEVKRILNKK